MEIEFLALPNGVSPVADFIFNLNDKPHKKILRTFELFEADPFAFMKYSGVLRKMSGYEQYDLWEFRIIFDKIKYRILCSIKKTKCYLVHVFIKTSQKTPAREINIAIERIKTHIE